MDCEARFEANMLKTYCREVSDFTSKLVELGNFIGRLERGGEHAVSIAPNMGVTERGLLLARASGINGLAVIARKT
jgi:hypothetical protein